LILLLDIQLKCNGISEKQSKDMVENLATKLATCTCLAKYFAYRNHTTSFNTSCSTKNQQTCKVCSNCVNKPRSANRDPNNAHAKNFIHWLRQERMKDGSIVDNFGILNTTQSFGPSFLHKTQQTLQISNLICIAPCSRFTRGFKLKMLDFSIAETIV